MSKNDGAAGVFRVTPLLVERVWGSRDLSPWYPAPVTTSPIGEAWLTGDACVIATGPLAGQTLEQAGERQALLVKLLFPQEKLSVQVHPDEAHAARLGGSAQPKTECWYILHAEPGATVAVGLKPGTVPEAVKQAIADGSLEELLVQVPVTAGDLVYVPAGTVHAIGPGVVILEVQQNSDTTYRLYDYGRPRELHLEQGLAVMKVLTDAGKVPERPIEGGVELIAVPQFTVQRYALSGGDRAFTPQGTECLVAFAGEGVLQSDGVEFALVPGEAVIARAGYSVSGNVTWVRCF